MAVPHPVCQSTDLCSGRELCKAILPKSCLTDFFLMKTHRKLHFPEKNLWLGLQCSLKNEEMDAEMGPRDERSKVAVR